MLNELYVVPFNVPLNGASFQPPKLVLLLFIPIDVKKSTYSKLIPAFPVLVAEAYAFVGSANSSWLNPNILTFFPSNVALSPTFNVFCTPFIVTVAVSESSVIDVSFDIAFAISAISSHEYVITDPFIVTLKFESIVYS